MRAPLMFCAAAVLLAACAGATELPTPSAPESAPATVASNGTVFITSVRDETATVTAASIAADGSLGQPQTVASQTISPVTNLAALDGLGDLWLTGVFTDYWTTSAELRRAGELLASVPAGDWCGGEGLTYGVCVLLDEQRIAHSTELGYDADSASGFPRGSVIVVSLDDGATIAEFGPFEGLAQVFGTNSPDHVILVTNGGIGGDLPAAVSRLDLRDGSTEPIGTSAPDWGAVCPLSARSVLGYASTEPTLFSVVGDGPIAPIELGNRNPAGCSADGRYLYLADLRGEAASLVRVDLATGQETDVLDLGQDSALVTR